MNSFPRLSPVRVLPLGDGYASTSVNTVIFRHHGLVTWGDYQFAAFYVSSTEMRVVRRSLRDETTQLGTITGSFHPADAHNCISLGLDSAGFIHIAYDHHAEPLKYRRSRNPLDVKEWTDPLPMTGRFEDRVTYPQFLMPPRSLGNTRPPMRLLFLYRHGGSGDGDICLKEYCPDSQTWVDMAERFVKGTDQKPWTANAYWNHPAFDSHGDLILSWIWCAADNASAMGDFAFYHNHGFARSPDGRRWFTSRGIELSLPMTPVNSEVILATTPGATLANMCSTAVDSRDRLHIAKYASETPGGVPQYQHIWFDGFAWRCRALTERKRPFDRPTWGPPMSRPEILLDPRDAVCVIYRCDDTGDRLVVQRLDAPDYAAPGTTFELWPDDVGHSEPIVDRLRWSRDGVLSILVQRTTQPAAVADRELPPEAVRIVDWRF